MGITSVFGTGVRSEAEAQEPALPKAFCREPDLYGQSNVVNVRSAITFERYTTSGMVEVVKIGTSQNCGDGVTKMNLTHTPIAMEFSVQFVASDPAPRYGVTVL